MNLKYIIIATNQEEEAKLLYGMLFSMKSFVAKLSPNDMKQGFLSYVTSAYRWRGKAINVKSRDGTNLRLECPDASEVTSLPPAEEMKSRLGQRVAEAVTTRQGPASLKRAQGYHMGHGKTDCWHSTSTV